MYEETLLHCILVLLTIDDGNKTEWERQREREEFTRIARVFQPLGSSLTSQFTRSQEEASTEGPAEVEVRNVDSTEHYTLYFYEDPLVSIMTYKQL